MPRIRSIKPEIWLSPQLMNLSRDARLLFIGLISQADDEGRGSADPRKLKAVIFPGDEDVAGNRIRELLAEIEQQGLAVTYDGNGHGPLYELPSFGKHQVINKAKPSHYPPAPPEDSRTSTVRIPDPSRTSTGGSDLIGSDLIGSEVLEDSDSRTRADVKAKPAYEGKEFHDGVIAAYHATLPNLPAVKVWSKQRAGALNARIRERLRDGKPADTPDYWRRLFEQVAASDFLTGRKTDFRADLEWLLRPENFAKVIEGRYAPGNGRADHAR